MVPDLDTPFLIFVQMAEIRVQRGDITTMRVDAIVNAANSSLMGGGGVDGAIHRAGGSAILEECRQIVAKLGSCPPGHAVITTAGALPARFVIHTVGPVWKGGRHDEADTLAACYRRSIQLAIENNLATIAFPNISTGIYGYPKQDAALIATRTVWEFLKDPGTLREVHFVCFDQENYKLYQSLLEKGGD